MKYTFLLTIFFTIAFLGCQELTPEYNTNDDSSTVLESDSGTGDSVGDIVVSNIDDHEEDGDYTWDDSAVIPISLNSTSITSDSSTGFTIDGTTITITSPGNYEFTGSLSEGQIYVNTDETSLTSVRDFGKVSADDEIVRILLNGVNITNTSTAPIFVEQSKKTIIVLNSDTENYLTDGTTYTFESADEDEPNATLFSKDDMTIYGSGSLIIDANYNDAITSKDGLIIRSGNIEITSADDGIRGKDYLVVKGGTTTITSTGDGLKSDNDSDAGTGFISVVDGYLEITSTGDCLAAENDVTITNGTFTLKSGGGSSAYTSSNSAKGIKASSTVVIDDGDFSINSADDAIHSNNSITINGGTFTIASGDDAIHSDSTAEVNGGTIAITKCYEGLESRILYINDGDIELVSSDDGLNVAGGTDGSGGRGGRVPSSGNYYMYINGGRISITASGDGLDANGSIVMTGGTVMVNGPTSSGNGAIDYDGSFQISGGLIVAAGSSGMAQAPSSSSSQNSILVTYSSTKSSGTLFHIEKSDGTEIVTFKPSKNYQSVAFSSPDLITGSSYKLYSGGSSTGTSENGLYEGGTYSGGTQVSSFTISSTVTRIN